MLFSWNFAVFVACYSRFISMALFSFFEKLENDALMRAEFAMRMLDLLGRLQ